MSETCLGPKFIVIFHARLQEIYLIFFFQRREQLLSEPHQSHFIFLSLFLAVAELYRVLPLGSLFFFFWFELLRFFTHELFVLPSQLQLHPAATRLFHQHSFLNRLFKHLQRNAVTNAWDFLEFFFSFLFFRLFPLFNESSIKKKKSRGIYSPSRFPFSHLLQNPSSWIGARCLPSRPLSSDCEPTRDKFFAEVKSVKERKRN